MIQMSLLSVRFDRASNVFAVGRPVAGISGVLTRPELLLGNSAIGGFDIERDLARQTGRVGDQRVIW